MSRYHSYINNSLRLLSQYEGKEPFSLYSKKFFAENKKFGSKDRRWISRICYNYFRTSHLFEELNVQVLMFAEFICAASPSELLLELDAEKASLVGLPFIQKLELLNIEKTTSIFPWKQHLSVEIDDKLFEESLLIQPDLFARIRPGNKNNVLDSLKRNQVEYELVDLDCIRFKNNTDLKELFFLNKQVVVQDLSSQRVATLFVEVLQQWKRLAKTYSVWDCCAASGGKSILAKDILPDFNLTVSDIRQGILNNLSIRFKEAGISNYNAILADLSSMPVRGLQSKFDLIIADVPCSGSGTWGRTPENLAWFDEQQIETYTKLQRKIVHNVLPSLRKGGFLLYCTCSVFSEENEGMVTHLQNTTSLKLLDSIVLKGYLEKADSLFAAVFISES